jgi:hypothetical protein
VDQYRVGLNKKKEFQIRVAVPDTDQIQFNWIGGFRIRYPDPARQNGSQKYEETSCISGRPEASQ